ncbi:MAG: XRE family transcriptional regulator [Betaproteobacteria bacterium]|jgi:transcriptional regulator with XRE-family HTH domain|nr:XRE family transcriptional regulator [Betaproteobacteria bacterium]NBT09575.1 XRE family transcriptional regulator [Betaproteobacteria bacterium]NBU48673.1 XRE family transcriptional regulator [Betaproteobacteria bacterium]
MKSRETRAQAAVFGRRLRQARKWAGLPQDRLGVAIGLDETTSSARISRYETGVHEPPIATARLLAMELGVPLPFLYCDDDDLAVALLNLWGLSAAERRRLLRQLDWRMPE